MFKKRHYPCLMLFVGLAAIFFKCSLKDVTRPDSLTIQDKTLSISISLPPGSSDSLSKAEVIISATDMDSIRQPLTIEKTLVHGTAAKIPLGYHRHIEIQVFNASNLMVYYGDTYADILSEKTVDISITLYYISGSVNITGIISEANQEFVQDSNTLALYHFNETNSTKLLDETERWNGELLSGTRCTGLFKGGVSFIPGQYAIFDTIIPDGTLNGTVEAYFKFNSEYDSAGSNAIFGNNGARCLLVYKNGTLIFLKNHSNVFKHVIGSVSIKANRWYHVAGTWGSKGMRIFLDGKLIGSNGDCSVYQSSPRGTVENVFYIGRKTYDGMEGVGIHSTIGFDGILDEIRISKIERY